MGESRERFWNAVCGLQGLWRLFFALSIVFLVLLVGLVFFVEPRTASYYVTILSILLAISLAAATGYVVRRCARIEEP